MSILSLKTRKKVNRNNVRYTGKGMVFIPDISGFTELVHSTDLVTGQLITFELLSTIIENNRTDMEIGEIEGDAVLFYKWNSPPAVDELYNQFERLKTAFDQKITVLEDKYGLKLDLNLKAIAHYGQMAEFSIGGFWKLYGEVVVEAHRLLKNNIPGRSYLLITNELMEASEHELLANTIHTVRSSKLCEIYAGLRNLCFTYVLFERFRLNA